MSVRWVFSSAVVVLLVAGGAAFLWMPAGDAEARAKPLKIHTKRVLSPVYHVDKKYKSMMGPQSTREVKLSETDELAWITGYQARMVDESGKNSMAQEFMCHSNLDLDPTKHRERVPSEAGVSGRLFTLSQGQFSIEFPPGFGIPLRGNEALSLTTQVLNLNHPKPDLKVRHDVTVRYALESEAPKVMKPLFQKSVYGLALLEGKDGHFGGHADGHEGEGCLERGNASSHEYPDDEGRKFTGHWVVPPGPEVNKTRVTELLSLPYDATAHYIAVHLHPFAETLELIDKTTKKTVFKSKAKNYTDKIGLKHVEALSSLEGIKFYKDHEYELVSVYNNTTKEPQDSMAVMYIYFHDESFTR